MKTKLTVSFQQLDQKDFVCILLPPQMIVTTNKNDLSGFSARMSDLLGLPVVLVGQGTGNFWQSFGEQPFALRLNQIGLERLAWHEIELR